jgi:uncharacterized protein (TIGR00369 family)
MNREEIDALEFPIPPAETFDATVGLEIIELTEDRAYGECPVRRELMQPWGLVHGGVYAAIAESLASWATGMAVLPGGELALGQSNLTHFLRPISAGTIHGTAIRRHRGRTSWVWDVDITDDEGRLCATSRVTVAVRPRPDSADQPR